MDDNNKHPVSEKKIKFKPHLLGSKKENTGWLVAITVASFFISAFMSFASSKVLNDVNNLVAFCVVLIIIFIGIVFDTIGTAVTAADETPFHAMASRKLYGAKQAIMLIRNANKVSSLCNDVIGDISGVISGTASAFIIFRIAGGGNGAAETTLTGLIISGLVASITIGGKATGKTIAIQNSNYIVYKVAVILKFLVGRISFIDRKKKYTALKKDHGKK